MYTIAVPLLFLRLELLLSECIKQKFQNMQQFHWRQIVVLCEIFLLLIVGFLPIKLNLLANAMVSFSCAMQVQAFRKVNGYAFASTMCIGNIRSGTDACVHTSEQRTGTHCSNPCATGRSSCYSESVPLWAVTSSVYLT